MSNTSNAHQVNVETFKKRTGLIQANIKSRHMVRCKGETKPREVEVKDADRYQHCSKVVWCLTTNKVYENYGQLVADTPPNHVMRENEEAYVWAYWSEDTEEYLQALDDAEREYQIAKGKDDKAKKRAVPRPETVDYSKIIGLLAQNQE